MEVDGDFLSDILLHGEGDYVAGLDEVHVLDTQDTNCSDEVVDFNDSSCRAP